MSATVSRSTQDLAAARATASFAPAKLNKLLNEGSRDTEMRQRINEVMRTDPAFDKSKRSVDAGYLVGPIRSDKRRAYMSRSEKLAHGLSLTKRLLEQVDLQDWDYLDVSLRNRRQVLTGAAVPRGAVADGRGCGAVSPRGRVPARHLVAGIGRAAGLLDAQVSQPRDPRLLRSDGAGSRLQRAAARDHRDVRPRDEDVRPPHALRHLDQVVGRCPGHYGHPLCGAGAFDPRRKGHGTPSLHHPDPIPRRPFAHAGRRGG